MPQEEITFHTILSSCGLAPTLLVRFTNGHAYRFLDGTACSLDKIATPSVWRGVARELARWHALLPTPTPGLRDPSDALTFQPSIWSTARKWLEALPTEIEEQRSKKDLLCDAFEYLVKNLLDSGSSNNLVSQP